MPLPNRGVQCRGEKDGDREMEVEETLREAEKLADEVEKDVMEE